MNLGDDLRYAYMHTESCLQQTHAMIPTYYGKNRKKKWGLSFSKVQSECIWNARESGQINAQCVRNKYDAQNVSGGEPVTIN